MKITVDGKRATLPFDGADYVVVHGATCPACGDELKARGTGITSHDHDVYCADAISLCCAASVGRMRTKVDTIFGIEEDEAVLNGRPRVYR